MRQRLPIIGLAAAYGVTLLLIVLWPTHVDRGLDLADRPPTTWLVDGLGLTPGQGYRVGEAGANVLLFLPLGALTLTLTPRVGWLRVTAGAAVLSVAIELVQTLARPGRTGTVSDVVANTAGAAAGALLVHWWLRRPRRTENDEGLRST